METAPRCSSDCVLVVLRQKKSPRLHARFLSFIAALVASPRRALRGWTEQAVDARFQTVSRYYFGLLDVILSA